MGKRPGLYDVTPIESLIVTVRGQKVILDCDLAATYGVPTKALNQAVKRNAERFPPDFVFQLTPEEKTEVVTICDHLAKLRFSPGHPYAFTEHGAIMAATVLNVLFGDGHAKGYRTKDLRKALEQEHCRLPPGCTWP